MSSFRKYIREIIKEFAVPDFEEDMLPIPGVAYPIEIEDIVVDDVADLILAPEGEQDLMAMDMLGAPPMDAEVIEDPIMDPITEPAVSIDIMPDAVDPVLDTIEDVLDKDEMIPFPYEEEDLMDPMMGSIIFHEPKPEKPKSSKGTKMARAKLFRMAKTSQSFHDRIDDDQYLPQWLHDKLAIAEDKLQDAYNYIDYKLHRQEEKTGCACHEGHVRKFAREWLLR